MQRHASGFVHPDPYQELFHRNAAHPAPGARRRRHGATVAAIAGIVVLACWAGSTTLYLLFRDDALRLFAERQIALMHAHDAQMAELQAEVVRLNSLKLADQGRIDRVLDELVRRQTELEERQATISALSEVASSRNASDPSREITGTIPGHVKSAAPFAGPTPLPTPLSDTSRAVPSQQASAPPELRMPLRGASLDARAAASAAEMRLADLAHDQRRLDLAQSEALNGMEEFFDGQAQRMRRTLAELGLAVPKSERTPASPRPRLAGAGGPFRPWLRPPEDPFARQIMRVHAARMAGEEMQRSLAAVPVLRPVAAARDVTSGFGMRVDPFLGQLAMHTGVDFDADSGDPVRAAASGTVVQSGRNGGYGIMVEVDHGNGLSTRYAHLSAALAAEGATVAAGAIVGRAGSTGRSTGPHLHYEIRRDGEPVNPQRYLRAGLGLEQAR
jgi:murein DD-endopeptidase MepM/ murein hydrolase activator NlpD